MDQVGLVNAYSLNFCLLFGLLLQHTLLCALACKASVRHFDQWRGSGLRALVHPLLSELPSLKCFTIVISACEVKHQPSGEELRRLLDQRTRVLQEIYEVKYEDNSFSKYVESRTTMQSYNPWLFSFVSFRRLE